MAETLTGAGAGLAANTLASVVMTRMPRLRSIDAEGRIPTKAALGVPLFFGGLASSGASGQAAMFSGLLMASDALSRWAETWAISRG